jgi:ABC-type amino acid transport system permease subunit
VTQQTPLYIRRPFLAGLIRQLPLLAVLVMVGVGLLVVTFDHWRTGIVIMGLTLIGAAVLRALLPVRRAGFLAVRSRQVDVALLAGTGVALTVIVLLIPFP